MATPHVRQPPPPVSIRDSFKERLPELPFGKHDRNAEISKGATATQLMPPPTIAIPRHHSHRWHLQGAESLNPQSTSAYSFAQQIKAIDQNTWFGKEALGFAQAFHQGKYFLPETEEDIAHANEADVVRSANLYLIHPVMQAMVAYPRYRRQVLSMAEDIEGAARTDLAFYIPRNGKATRAFAVAEYKKRETFTARDFDHSEIIKRGIPSTWGTDPKVIEAKLARIVALQPPGPAGQSQRREAVTAFEELVRQCDTQLDAHLMQSMESAFRGNAEKLIKQAASYMVMYRVRHVVLFNWDCMVLCYFPWLDISKSIDELRHEYRVIRRTSRTAGKEVAPYPVEVDIYNTDDPKMRLALLGFMQDAWEEIQAVTP